MKAFIAYPCHYCEDGDREDAYCTDCQRTYVWGKWRAKVWSMAINLHRERTGHEAWERLGPHGEGGILHCSGCDEFTHPLQEGNWSVGFWMKRYEEQWGKLSEQDSKDFIGAVIDMEMRMPSHHFE